MNVLYELAQPVLTELPPVGYSLEHALAGLRKLLEDGYNIGVWEPGQQFHEVDQLDLAFTILKAERGCLALAYQVRRPGPQGRGWVIEMGTDFQLDLAGTPFEDHETRRKVAGLTAEGIPALILRKILKSKGSPHNGKLNPGQAAAFDMAMAQLGASGTNSQQLCKMQMVLVGLASVASPASVCARAG